MFYFKIVLPAKINATKFKKNTICSMPQPMDKKKSYNLVVIRKMYRFVFFIIDIQILIIFVR
jgi:hypothetical protein